MSFNWVVNVLGLLLRFADGLVRLSGNAQEPSDLSRADCPGSVPSGVHDASDGVATDAE